MLVILVTNVLILGVNVQQVEAGTITVPEGPILTAEAGKLENDWRARPFFIARPKSLTEPDPLSPSQIIDAYNLNSSTGGAGATVAIVDAYDDPTIANDLVMFSSNFSLPSASFEEHKMRTTISVDSGWALEISLDVEWAHAIAPNATILLVEAASNRLSDLLAAVSYATGYPGVKGVSMSWGGDEFVTEASYDSCFSSAGITFFAASGDSGAGVQWPSSSSNVVGVGGTTLNLNPDGSVASETAWNDSGGGLSAYEAIPAYQTTYGLTYTSRASPDVSYDADPNTGVYVYDSTSFEGSSGWWDVGGTSVGPPQWAAIQALGLSANDNNFYQDAASSSYASYFRDITSGSNGYLAGSGYDLVTGLGSPVTTSFAPPTTPGFSLSASPTTLSIGDGGNPTTGTSTITVTSFNGFTGTVTLSTTAPTRLKASLSPTSISPPGQSTLNVIALPWGGGAYFVTVTGSSGVLNHTITVPVQVTMSPNICINVDGSVTPVGAPIVTSDSITYYLTGNISCPPYRGIVVEKSNITIDGKGYTVEGDSSGIGLYWENVNNVEIKNTNIRNFAFGIYLVSSHNSSISGNNITANTYYGIVLGSCCNSCISRNSIANNYEGIYLYYSSNYNSISSNDITASNSYGIELDSSSNNCLSENTFTNNGLYVSDSYQNSVGSNTVNGKPLVYLEGVTNSSVSNAGQVILVTCNNITVENLNLSKTGVGLELWETNNSTISGNNITANSWDGLDLLYYSSNNGMSGNKITANSVCGVELDYSANCNSISGNNITANSVCGVELDYSSNNSISGNKITNNGDGILLYSSSNNGMSGNNIGQNSGEGIDLESSSNNDISGNNITQNDDDGILLEYSSNNGMSGNNITANSVCGVELDYSSNNSITRNDITQNDEEGIDLESSSNNGISGNNITANDYYGIYLGFSYNNTAYHNDFVDNTNQAVTYNSTGSWDNGYPSGGNYWSNYNGKDLYCGPYQNMTGSDGIGDSPYVIDSNNTDHYPLMQPWTGLLHDVAVTDVTANRSWVYQGLSINVSVTVWNNGNSSANVNVTLYYYVTAAEIIGTQDITLSAGENETLLFVWDTKGAAYNQNYTIMAVASTPFDINFTDNILATGPITVRILGDINGDGKVDGRDIVTAAKAFGTRPGDPRWNPDADVNQDGRVDGRDITLIARNFGK